MKIVIGSDHGGFELKAGIKSLLQEMDDIEIEDIGTHDNGSVDYPDIAKSVCETVLAGRADKGIVICGTGVGISMAANKIKGIRAALCTDVYTAKMSREHNDANVLALGGRVTGVGLAEEIVKAWLSTEFAGGRHARRVAKIMELDKA